MKVTIDALFKNQYQICEEIHDNSSQQLFLGFMAKALIAGGIYGFVMGIYHSVAQAFLSALKVPLLFIITLLICIPTLHFMGLILGSKLKLKQTLSILTYAISVTCVILASFAPISLFFIFSHSSYKFIMILHVLFFAISGLVGLYFVRKNFKSMFELSVNTDEEPGMSRKILPVWMVLYMFVGCQLAYILSPFVGTDAQLILFTNSDYNFFTYMLQRILG